MELEPNQDRLGSVYAVPLVLFFVLVLLLLSLLHRQQALTLLCLVTVGVFGVSAFWSRVSTRATNFHLRANRSTLFPEERLGLCLEATNGKALPIHLSVSAAFSGGLVAGKDKKLPNRASTLLGYQSATFRWDLTACRRGVHTVGPVDLTIGDPFGFFPRQSRISDRQEVVVYPRLVPLSPVFLSKRDAFGTPGHQIHIRDPVHIIGTRDYQSSEPARHIHWKASARYARLQSKVFAPSLQEKTLLLLDVSGFCRRPSDAQFEEILEIVASLAVQKDRQGAATGFLTNAVISGRTGAVSPPARSPQQIGLILEALARIRMSTTGDLLTMLRRSLNIPWGTSCAVFTLEFNREIHLLKAYLSRHRIPVRILTTEEALAMRARAGQLRAEISNPKANSSAKP